MRWLLAFGVEQLESESIQNFKKERFKKKEKELLVEQEQETKEKTIRTTIPIQTTY